jgi:hypothetical protein
MQATLANPLILSATYMLGDGSELMVYNLITPPSPTSEREREKRRRLALPGRPGARSCHRPSDQGGRGKAAADRRPEGKATVARWLEGEKASTAQPPRRELLSPASPRGRPATDRRPGRKGRRRPLARGREGHHDRSPHTELPSPVSPRGKGEGRR